MAKNETYESFYHNPMNNTLNYLFSANYACLCARNEQNPFDEKPRVISRDELFSSKKSAFGRDGIIFQTWVEEKIKNYSLSRNRLIETIDTELKGISVDELINEQKYILIDLFNHVYGSNKKFEDVFDEDSILDKRFTEDLIASTKNEKTSVGRSLFAMLKQCYEKYLYVLFEYQSAKSFLDIYNCLCDDLTSEGNRTFYYGNPRNKDVFVVKRETLEHALGMIVPVYDYEKFVVEEYDKTFKKLEKSMIKHPETYEIDRNAYDDYLPDYQKHINLLSSLQEAMDILNAMSIRFESANKEYQSSSHKRYDKLIQFLSGEGFSNKLKLKVDSVYMHKFEISRLTTLLKTHESLAEYSDKLKNELFGLSQESQPSQK